MWFWLLRVRVPLATHLHFRFADCPQTPLARALLKERGMLNPAVIDSTKAKSPAANFWLRILADEELSACDDLQKLVVGCEIIAALDAVDLLAA